MMISNADFEELFPALFQPEPARATRPKSKVPGAVRVARRDGDGGRPAASTRGSKPQAATARKPVSI